MGYGLSIAGHVIIALLLMLGVFERIEPISVAAIPVEIVMEPPAPSAPVTGDQDHPFGIPAMADVEKRAKALVAALNVNGIDRPSQPGHDGRDPGANQAGIPSPSTSSGTSASSRTAVIAPIGPTPPQTTAREPGDSELTALREQKIQCGVMAKRPTPAAMTQGQARVRGFATEAQTLAIMRSNQAALDRHVNPSYLGNQRLFVESLDGVRKFIALLPSGLTVNVGDMIQYDYFYIDPADSCQFIPPLAVRKL